MLILAFDTSGMHGSVALLDGPRLLEERILSTERRSAQTLASAIVDLLAARHVAARQIRLVATTIGPGSFTGLRVGVTAAKTFAYAVGAEVIGVSTLEAIAHGISVPPISTAPTEIHAVLDAQRKELFVGRFRCESSGSEPDILPTLQRLTADEIITVESWLTALLPGTIIAGAVLDRLQDRLPVGVFVDQSAREPRAAVVGQLAWRDYKAGRRDDLWKLAPIYLRPSYAEEKAAKAAPPSGA